MNIFRYLQKIRRKKKKNSEVPSLKNTIIAVLLSLALFFSLVPILTYATYVPDISNKDSIMNRNNTGVVLYTRENQPFFTLYQGKEKILIPLSQIPNHTKNAIIASEDKDFYHHSGFSLKAIARALITDLQEGNFAYGGSTITQQLIKNTLLTTDKSITRKFQEIILAQELERRYEKDEILEMYLNSVYFGEGAFGVEEAAQKYFNKKANNLTLAQSALLAALLPSPSQLSPLSNDGKEAKLKQEIILKKMVEEGYISNADFLQAKDEELQFNPQDEGLNTKAFHFAMMVKDELISKYGEEEVARSGFKIKTTIDLKWQDFADEVVKKQVEQLTANLVSNAAVVVEDPENGEIKALVGSKNWQEEEFGKVNVAIMPRQPGSAFKPIIYAAAFEEGLITPATILKDQPVVYGANYRPKNYDGRFRGQVTVRRALANSLNVPSVEVMSKLGLPNGIQMAKRLGLTTFEDSSRFGLSMVLGAGEIKLVELTNAYAVFANKGVKNDPTTILEIKDKYSRQVYQYHPKQERVLKEEVAFLISSILSDNKARAEIFGTVLDISRPAAVKTGTTEDYRDSLTVGFTPSLAIGVWVGNNDGRPMNSVAGSLGAAPIWKQLMEEFLKETPVEQFEKPEGVTTYNCQGFLSGPQNATPSAYFYQENFIKGSPIPPGCSTNKPSLTPSNIPTPTPTQITPVPTITQPPAQPTQTPPPTNEPPTQQPTNTQTPTITTPQPPQIISPNPPNIPSPEITLDQRRVTMTKLEKIGFKSTFSPTFKQGFFLDKWTNFLILY